MNVDRKTVSDTSNSCSHPNIFSDEVAPFVQSYLPAPGSVAEKVLDHTTGAPSFFSTISEDLCDDGRMGEESRDAAVGFISRSATTGVVLTGAATLAAIGVATAGAPLVVLGAGVAALAVLPPVINGLAQRVGSFFGGL